MRNARHGQAARLLFVAILTAIALGTTIPNLYYLLYPMYGTFDIAVDDQNVVIFTTPLSRSAGVNIGDRIVYSAMKPDDRFEGETGRFAPIGRRVTFVLERNGKLHTATLTSIYYRDRWIWALPVALAKKTASLVLILLGAVLFLIAPTPLSRAVFLFVIGCANAVPYFFSFLPLYAYYVITIAVDALWSSGAVGFLLIAVALASGGTWRWTTAVGAGAFAVTFGLAALADTRMLLFGLASSPIYNAFNIARMLCFAAAIVILVISFVRAHVPVVRGGIALLFAAGCITLFLLGMGYIPGDWLTLSTRSARIAFKTFEESGATVSAIAALAVVALIVRERVVDTGLVASRVLFYGVLSFAIIASLIALNWGFGPQLANYSVIIPLEICGAVALGYWFSGVRDVAGALSIAATDAPMAAIQGRASDERDLFARALGFAERTRQQGLTAEIHARHSFSAWSSANDAEYEHHIQSLATALGNRSMRGLRGYLSAARNIDRADSNELPEWRARAALLLCSASDDSLVAQQYARDALLFADAADSQWLRLLAFVALSEMCPQDRLSSIDGGRAIARSAGWLAVDKSLAALRANRDELGVLQPFVEVRLRKKRPSRPPLRVSFFTGRITAFGEPVSIHEKELELLFTVAEYRNGVRDEELLDRLWPEADGDSARNAFKVCLHRLRKSVGDSHVVVRKGKRYELATSAEVDLWPLQEAIAACRRQNDSEQIEALRRHCTAMRAGAKDRSSLGSWFAPFERTLQEALHESQALLELTSLRVRP